MERLIRSQVDTADEILKEFNNVIDEINKINNNVALIETKLCQVAIQTEVLLAEKKKPPKKVEPPKKSRFRRKKKGSVLMKTIVTLIVLATMLFGSVSLGQEWPITYSTVATPDQLVQLLRNRFANQTANSYIFTPLSSAPSSAAGKVYYDSGTNKLQLYNDTSWVTIDTAGGVSLDSAYDFGTAGAGRTINATHGSVVIQNTEADTNAILTLTHSGIVASDQVMLITKSGAGDMPCIEFENTGGGADLEGSGATWSISKAGATIVSAIDVTGTAGITLQNDDTITNTTDSEFTFTQNGLEDIILDMDAGTNAVGLKSGTGVIELAMGAVDDLTGVGTIVFDSDASSITLTSNDTDENLTVELAGSTASSLILVSAGTGVDAIDIDASGGGIDIDATDDIAITVTSSTNSEDLLITQTGTNNSSIIITAAGTDEDAIKLETTNSAGDIWIDSGDDLIIDVVGQIDIDMTGTAGEDFSVVTTAGSVILSSAEDVTDAINIDATAGGIDIDAAGEAGQDIVVTNTGGSIQLVQTEAVDDGINIDATGGFDLDAAMSIVLTSSEGAADSIQITSTRGGIDILCATTDVAAEDLDIGLSGSTDSSIDITSSGTGDDAVILEGTAGGLDIDFVKSIYITSTENSADSIKIQSTLGGIDILCDASGTENIDISNTGGSVYITASEGADGAIKLETTSTSGQIALVCADTSTDAIQVDSSGGIEINAVEDITITLTAGSADEDILITTAGDTDNHVSLISTGTSANALVLDASATAGGIDMDAGTSGIDIDCTGGPINIDNDGTGDDITLTSDAGSIYLKADQTGETDSIKLTAGSGITITSTAEHSAWTHTATGAADDLTISVAGAQNASLILQSAGNDADALSLKTVTNSSAIAINSNGLIDMDAVGVITVDAADDITIKLTTSTDAEDLTIQVDGDDNCSIILDSDGTGDDAISAQASAGGVDIDGALSVAITSSENTSDAVYLHASAGGMEFLAAGAADEDINIINTSGSVYLSAGEDATDAIDINAGVGSVDIDAAKNITMNAATDITITVDSTTTGDDLSLVVSGDQDAQIILDSDGTAADCILIQQNTAASGGIRLHANDSTANADGASSIQLLSDLGAIGIKTSLAHATAIDIDSTAGGIAVDAADDINILLTANTANEDILIATGGDQDSHITITADGSSVNAFTLLADAGGIDIDAATDKIHIQNAADGAEDDIVLYMTGSHDASIILENTQGTGTDAVSLQATTGGVDIDAAATKDITLNGGQIILASEHNTAGAIQLTAATAGGAETIVITNTYGTNSAAIALVASAGGVEIDSPTGKAIALDGGSVAISSKTEGASAIALTAAQGVTDTIVITNTQGTGSGAITLASSTGGISLVADHATNGDITIDAEDNISLIQARNTGIIVDTGANAIFLMEGATSNAYDTTLALEDPTVARTITLPDHTGGVPIIIGQSQSDANNSTDTAAVITGATITLPANWFSAGKVIRMTLWGDMVGDTDKFDLTCYMHDGAKCNLSSTDAEGADGFWQATYTIYAISTTSQRIFGTLIADDGTDIITAYEVDTQPFTSEGTISIKFDVDNTADDVFCRLVTIETWTK